VQQGLASLADKSQLLQQLPEFMEFLMQLLQDHNFKMATAGLEMLAGLANSFGTLLQPHLRSTFGAAICACCSMCCTASGECPASTSLGL
jgi:hypothetical protein